MFRRFTRALEGLRNPLVDQYWNAKLVLADVNILCAEMGAAGLPPFDEHLNGAAIQQAIRRGSLDGICNVSGCRTQFIASSDNLRESLVSTASSSINRHRFLICTLSMALFGHPRATLAKVAAHINENQLKTYIAETNSVLCNFLKRKLKKHLLVSSEYFGPEHQSGEIVSGILHEDLQCTSFADETFDIIMTSEVLEHVPDAPVAEKELMRILKPGGTYCFTVPFLPIGEHDDIRAEHDEQNQVRYLAEPQYHQDPVRPREGILVYRLFSFNDLKRRFEDMGHEFKSYRFWSESLGILGSDCWAHTVRKAPKGAARAQVS